MEFQTKFFIVFVKNQQKLSEESHFTLNIYRCLLIFDKIARNDL